MDSAKRCRDQSAECLRLMKLTSSQAEAKLLGDIAQSWVRLANQIERYVASIKRPVGLRYDGHGIASPELGTDEI